MDRSMENNANASEAFTFLLKTKARNCDKSILKVGISVTRSFV